MSPILCINVCSMPIFIGRLLTHSFSSLWDYTCDSPSCCLEFLSHVLRPQTEWPLLLCTSKLYRITLSGCRRSYFCWSSPQVPLRGISTNGNARIKRRLFAETGILLGEFATLLEQLNLILIQNLLPLLPCPWKFNFWKQETRRRRNARDIYSRPRRMQEYLMRVSAQVHYPREMSSLTCMVLLREYQILDMFYPQDYKVTLKSKQ